MRGKKNNISERVISRKCHSIRTTKSFLFYLTLYRCRILVPNDASIAVMQGAVMFGQKPNIIDSRIMSTTYGFEVYRPFNNNVHPIEKRHVIEGVAWCKDCFEVLVKENEIVQIGEKRSFPNYRPSEKSQTKAAFRFYNSSNPEAKYITDPAVGPSVGKAIVQSPDVSRGTDRNIDVCVTFGGTEIKVTAIDKTSANTATAYLDFLCEKALS